jgi:hypothetical protein
MRLVTLTGFVASLIAWGAFTHADDLEAEVRFTVEGGDISRRNAPVSAKIQADSLPGLDLAGWELTAGDGSPAIRAGSERLGPDTVILYWIEPDLPAGSKKVYGAVRTPTPAKAKETFRFIYDSNGWRDLAYGDRGVYRHMNRYDPADHQNTFKPFHHVYGMHDEGFITNGPGSDEWKADPKAIRFPHHRGLFFGFNKTPYGDFWHGKDGVSQRHKEYTDDREFAGPIVARESSVVEWVAKDGKPVIRDTRELMTWRISDKQYVLDFDVTLESLTGEAIPLSGDPQHAGFHFRAANEVGQSPTTKPGATTRPGTGGGNATYIRPASAVDTKHPSKDVWGNCPWVYCAFTIKGNPYGVTQMSAPTNPQPTVYSTRPYGRFGAFFDGQSVSPDNPLKLKYRFIVRDGSTTPDSKQLEAEYQDYVTPLKVTVAK